MDAHCYSTVQPQMIMVNTSEQAVAMPVTELALSPDSAVGQQGPLLQQVPQQSMPIYQQQHSSQSYIPASTPTLSQTELSQQSVAGTGLIQPVQPIYQPHQLPHHSAAVAQHMHPHAMHVQNPVPYAHHPLISSIALQHAMRTNPQMMPLSYKPSPIHYNQSANADLTFRNVPVPVNNKRVTDQTGCDVEKFLVNTLRQNQRDRFTIYTLETEMIGLCTNTHLYGIRFPKMTSYHRMLVHRIATYFGLDHNVDDSGRQVVCHKGPNTRIPLMRLRDLVVIAEHADAVRCGYAPGPAPGQQVPGYFSSTPQTSSAASQQDTPRDGDGASGKERKPTRGMQEPYGARKMSPRPKRHNQKPIHEGYPHPSAFYPNYPYINGHYVPPSPQLHHQHHPRELSPHVQGQSTGLLPQPYQHYPQQNHPVAQYTPHIPPPAYTEGALGGYVGGHQHLAVNNAVLSGNNVVVHQTNGAEFTMTGQEAVLGPGYIVDPNAVRVTVSAGDTSSEDISPRALIDAVGEQNCIAIVKPIDPQNGGGSPHSSESIELDEKSSKPEQDQHLEQQKEQDERKAEAKMRAITLAHSNVYGQPVVHPYYPQHPGDHQDLKDPRMHQPIAYPGQPALHVLPSGMAQQLALYVQQQQGLYRPQPMPQALIPVEDIYFRIKFQTPADVRRIEAELALNFLQRQYGGIIYWNNLDGTREEKSSSSTVDKKLPVSNFQIFVILPSTVVAQVSQEIASKNFVIEQLNPATAMVQIFGKVEVKPKKVLPVVVPGGDGVAVTGEKLEAIVGAMAGVKIQ